MIQKIVHPVRLVMVGVVLLLAACTPLAAPPPSEPSPPVAPTAAAATMQAVSDELISTLGNLTYAGILPDQMIEFTDGIAFYDDGGSGKPFVKLVDNLIVTGDLNGDGNEDAVVLLEDFSSGSGHFTFLATVLDVASALTPTTALMVGDRIQVKSLTIEEGQVVANLVAQGSSDPACCPSWNVQKHFAFQDGTLVESSSAEVSQVALADLNDTSWQLVDLADLGTPGDSSEAAEPVLPDAPITLLITDGQATGSAGCNNYNSSLASNDDMPQSLIVGPIATTQKLCPDPIASQESTYLARLQDAAGWRYHAGNLAIIYRTDDNSFAELLFERQDDGVEAEQGATDEGSVADVLPRFEPLDKCFVDPPQDLEIDLDVDCGYVVVPEFYHAASSRELKLGITRLNAQMETGKAPLFMFAGGPGQAHVQSAIYSLFQPELLGNVLLERDIVLVEQRGTEYTDTFLDCPAIYSTPWQVTEQKFDDEQALAIEQDLFQTCIDDFEAQGINFDAYNSVENAADVNAVRDALGYEQIIYYGASYGSQLGQHVMRDFPEILEAVVLDGANSLSRKSWVEDRALDAQWGIDNLTQLCEADEKCRATYDIPALVDAALGLFDDGPIAYTYVDPSDPALSIDVEVTQADLVSLIYSLQGGRISTFSLPAILLQVTQGGVESVREILGQMKGANVLASRGATRGGEALLMHFAMVCSDDPVTSVDNVNIDGTSKYATLFGQGAAQEYVTVCAMMHITELPDSTDVNVTLDVPTLLLSGGLEVATPSFRSQIVADALPNATHVIFPGRTHVQIAGINLCAAQVATQFVLDPTAPLDMSCIEEDQVLGFVLPDGTMSSE